MEDRQFWNTEHRGDKKKKKQSTVSARIKRHVETSEGLTEQDGKGSK